MYVNTEGLQRKFFEVLPMVGHDEISVKKNSLGVAITIWCFFNEQKLVFSRFLLLKSNNMYIFK